MIMMAGRRPNNMEPSSPVADFHPSNVSRGTGGDTSQPPSVSRSRELSDSDQHDSGQPRKKVRKGVNYPRERISQACDVCRTRKTRCSGDRPCQFCVDKGIECTDMVIKSKDSAEGLLTKRLEEMSNRVKSVEEQYELRIAHLEQCFRTGISSPRLLSQPMNQNDHHQCSVTRDLGILADHAQPTIGPLSPYEVDTEVQNLRFVATPSLSSLSEKFHNFSPKMRWPTPGSEVNGTISPSWIINVILNNLNASTCYRQEDELARIFFTQTQPMHLRLDRPTCKRFSDEYFQKINCWYPIMSQERWLKEYQAASQTAFQGGSLSEVLVFLTLALGSAASGDSIGGLPGHDYFLKGVATLGSAGAYTSSLKVVQCKFLISLYCLHALQPRSAAIAISEASHQCLPLQKLIKYHPYEDHDREYYLRTFWCCSVLEHEVMIHERSKKSGIADHLNLKTDWPDLMDDQKSMFFLAGTQIRQIQNNIDTDLCPGDELSERRLLMIEHQHQLTNWHLILPKELKFSIDHIEDLFDDRKGFLRVQYHCAQTLLAYPSVFAILVADDVHGKRLLKDHERYAHVTKFFSSAHQVLEATSELLSCRTVVTWLVCEALSVVLTKLLIIWGSTILRPFMRPDTLEFLLATIEHLEPWTSCPRIERAYQVLKSALETVQTAEAQKYQIEQCTPNGAQF